MTPLHSYSLVFVAVTQLLLTLPNVRAAFTAEEKIAVVNAHNKMREAAVPEAAGMRFVIWSDRLEALGQRISDPCPQNLWAAHKFDGDYRGLGQNIYKGYDTAADIVLTWYSERIHFNPTDGSCLPGKDCGHYHQVITDGVTEIGCGAKECPDKDNRMVVCQYSVGLTTFYNLGKPCSYCPANMPLCLNGLCVSKEIVESDAAKGYYPSASLSVATCDLNCKNCGIRKAAAGSCACDCGSYGSGAYCETKNAANTAKCSLCSGQCLNGGEEDTSVTTECKCKCKDGASGDRCEITKAITESGVALTIGAAKPYNGIRTFNPPVTKTLFKSKVWPILKVELALAVNSFCSMEANFVKCCLGKTFPGASAASSKHITEADLRIQESTFAMDADGFLSFLLYAVSSSSALCSAGASGRRRRATAETYVPQSVMLSAVQASKDAISAKLTGSIKEIRERVVLKKVEMNVPSASSGGAPSGGAPSGGAPSGGAPSGGAPGGGAPGQKSKTPLKAKGFLVTISCTLALTLVRGG